MRRHAWLVLILLPDVSHTTELPATSAVAARSSKIDSAVRLRKADSFAAPNHEAVLYGLMWLSRHQDDDGMWSVTGYANHCEGDPKCLPNPGSDELDLGVTGLALYAFVGAGYTHLSKDTYRGICFGTVVKQALKAILKRQNQDGSFGDSKSPRFILNHALATNALVAEYASTASAMLRDPAQKAVDFLLSTRYPKSGWGYTSGSGPDMITTGWALHSIGWADSAELKIGDARPLTDELEASIASLTNPKTGRAGYRHRGFDAAVIPGRNDRFAPLPTCTAAALACNLSIDRKLRSSDEARRQVELLMASLPQDSDSTRDFHHWFWASLAIFKFDGPSGAAWKKWSPNLKKVCLQTMIDSKERCVHESWEPRDKWSCEAGRVYAVAMNTLTLEIYYRYPNTSIGWERSLR